MRIKPDQRHLMGGMVGAAVLTALLVYSGLGSPGAVYYQPVHDVHPIGGYGRYADSGPQNCAECHDRRFKDPDNDGCAICHPGGTRIKAKNTPAKAPVAAAYVNPFPQSKAALKFHKLVEAQSCGACHVEHAENALGEFLRLELPQRAAFRGYPENVHGFLPKEMRGEPFCATCHDAADLEAFKRRGAPTAPPAATPAR